MKCVKTGAKYPEKNIETNAKHDPIIAELIIVANGNIIASTLHFHENYGFVLNETQDYKIIKFENIRFVDDLKFSNNSIDIYLFIRLFPFY